MAAWPELDELKQVLDVTSEDWDGDDDDTRLTALLLAAVEHVKRETGQDTETPSDSLGRAALRLAELMALRPEVAAALTRGGTSFIADPAYNAFIYGERRHFGIG
jgi:hypothetical protein